MAKARAVPVVRPDDVNKREAMEILGVGKRTFEELVQASGLDVKYAGPEPGRPYKEARYRRADIERLRDERIANPKPAVPIRVPAAAIQTEAGVQTLKVLAAMLDRLESRAVATEPVRAVAEPLPPATPDRLFVPLKEAAAILGMPETWVLEQIEDGRLMAERVAWGRGGRWMIRRADLSQLPARSYKGGYRAEHS